MRKVSHIFCEVIASYMFPFGVAVIIVYTGTYTAELAAAGLLFHSHWLYIHVRSLTSFDLSQICIVRSDGAVLEQTAFSFLNKAYIAWGTYIKIRKQVLQVKTVTVSIITNEESRGLGLFSWEEIFFHILDRVPTVWCLWPHFGAPFLTRACHTCSSAV